MSYALESKKRKFNRVLDSLSKPLTGDGSSKNAKDPLMAARERIAASSSSKRVRVGDSVLDGVSSKSTISRILRVSSSSPNVRPNFVPWDRDRFLERLETFRPVTRWSPKPAPINEVEWAKRGWSCTDYMRVTCVGGCGSSVVVKLPDEVDDFEELDSEKVQDRNEVRAKIVEEYKKVISEGHSENCPWRNKGCDATIHRLPLTNPDVAIRTLKTRYYKIVELGAQLPSENTIEVPDHMDMSAIISILPLDFLHPNSESATTIEAAPIGSSEPEIDTKAFALAFLGWDVVKDGSSGLLECRACFRRLGLWLYKPKEDGKSAIYSKLPVAGEHMEYCPWVNGIAQSGTGKLTEKPEDLLCGWEILAQSIRTKHRRRVKSITGILEESPRDSDVSSADFDAVDETAQKAKDKEWWSKLRRVREALHVKAPKKNVPGNT